MKSWTVGDVMTRDVVYTSEIATYREIVEKLAEHRVSALPVIDSERHVVGIVSEADLLHKVELGGHEQEHRVFEGRARRAARAKSAADLAKDLMSAPPIVATAEMPLAVAAKLLDLHGVKRLPVVDATAQLIGIVSRVDLLRPYLRSDEQIREDVREGVLRQTMWLDPDAIDVAVTDGSVTLSGSVGRKTTAELLGHLAAAIAGVTHVQNGLTWETDDTKMANSGYFRSHPFSTEYRD